MTINDCIDIFMLSKCTGDGEHKTCHMCVFFSVCKPCSSLSFGHPWPQMLARISYSACSYPQTPPGDYYSVDALFGTRTEVCIIYARPSSNLKNGLPPSFLVLLTK